MMTERLYKVLPLTRENVAKISNKFMIVSRNTIRRSGRWAQVSLAVMRLLIAHGLPNSTHRSTLVEHPLHA